MPAPTVYVQLLLVFLVGFARPPLLELMPM